MVCLKRGRLDKVVARWAIGSYSIVFGILYIALALRLRKHSHPMALTSRVLAFASIVSLSERKRAEEEPRAGWRKSYSQIPKRTTDKFNPRKNLTRFHSW
jgi:hypothetical protein